MLPNRNFKLVNRKIKKKGKLPYSSKAYKNPFFPKKKRVSLRISVYRFSFKTKLIIWSAMIFLALGAYFLFYSNYFSINNITAAGAGRIDSAVIETIAWQQIEDNFLVIFPQKNIFLFSKKMLYKKLNSKYSFDSLIINKDLPNNLVIEYNEKKYAIIWQENENYYYVDDYGSLISEANLLEISQKDYPIIKNESNDLIINNKITVEAVYFDYAKQLFSKFKDYENEFKIERFVVDSDVNTLKAVLESGPVVYFNISEDVDKQVSKLLIIKNEKIKEDFNAKTYIDVRYGDSVYYR